MNERKKGILLSYLNIVLHAVVGFAYVPLLLHYIGKSEYGLYQLIGSFIAYFSIMDFGLSTAVVRFYTKYKALRDSAGMENVLALAARAYALIAILLAALGWLFYANIAALFSASMSATEISTAKRLFVLLLVNIILTVSTMVFRSVINAHERFLFLKGLETVQLLLQPLLVALIVQKYPGALTVAAVQTALNIGLIAARAYYCFAKLGVKIKFHYWDGELFADFKKLALSVFVVTLIDQVFFKTNQVILGIMAGTSAVAVYSIASLIYMNYMALSLAISGVYLPHITEMVARREPVRQLTQLFIKVGRWQFYLLALVATGFIIFGRQFIEIWAGKGFEDAYWITLLIIIPFTVDLIQNIGLSIMQAQNRYDFRAKVFCVMGIFNLCLAFMLVKKYGGIGCAFATGLALFLANGAVMNVYYLKVIGLDIKRFWQEMGRIAIVVAAVAVIGYAVNIWLYSENILAFAGKILAYTMLYAAVMYKYCFNGDEREKVQAALAKVKEVV
ncbi:MAG: oligosaccharide flippase family protein [Phascolarctobacterium sp.]|uniref:lipopolysaccharide biosynthesis protein n=1 Tax=Phascolarctobacterium sp. TaxID=2049039 RepID=UPI0026DABAA3|nr:oligosaccharide flippase family protein [Phascolarctobacterium sp.]MDO4921930.1 oligosaccharide flippase family protein [Phascolarctobacterium sp.]